MGGVDAGIVIRTVLERGAAEKPDEVFVRFEDGTSWTRGQALSASYASGQALRDAGVGEGDRVAVFLPNGPDFLRAWWGTCVIGATLVPINLAYRGAMLEHLLALSDPRVTVVDPRFEEQMASCERGAVARRIEPTRLVRADPCQAPGLQREIRPWDPHLLLLTSGTTGPSKLAEISYQASYVGGSWFSEAWGGDSQDILLIDLPLFHGAALYQATAGLARGVRFAVRSAPDLKRYWEVARDTGATMGFLLSSMVPYLMAQPPRPAEREHSLRALVASPLPRDVEAFGERFGIADIVTALGSTEAPGSTVRVPGEPLVPGYCGRLRDGFQVRLADENDIEVPVGEVGEVLVRADHPWHLMTGYVNDPPAQARAMRNGWFHTGDLARVDEDGHYFFVDRSKDSLRRRGENISSFEVEAALNLFEGVAESACVAYRDPELVDDEVKVWVVVKPGVSLDLEGLFLHCVETLPRFMVPRYLEVTDELPKTPSARVQKFLLRERGNSPATWDRSAAGYVLTRRGLERGPTGS